MSNYCTHKTNNTSGICDKCLGKEVIKEDWEEVFDMFYDKNENGGSSRWLVAPSNVKIFIKGLLERKNYETKTK